MKLADLITKKEEENKILSYREITGMFYDYNCHTENPETLYGAVVIASESFDKEYPLEDNTYIISSESKAFKPNMLGYSIYANNITGTDNGVRLDNYLKEEKAGKNGWIVDKCFIITKEEIDELNDTIF